MSKSILVIEDDQFLREFYVALLKENGFTVDAAVDGEEGWNKLTGGGYDLILLDLVLPKMDGIHMLRTLKNTPTVVKKPNGKIVVLTNLGQESTIAEAVSLGIAGYMIKSDYNPEQFLKEINNYLQK